VALAEAAWGAEDPAVRALQQHQLQRQQQQDALQLRMLQQQRSARERLAEPRRQQALEQLQIDQQQRQQQLHYRQAVETGGARPDEDEAASRARAQMELRKAGRQSREQLRRFESELQMTPEGNPPRPPKLE
jgi:hypothetical protein